MTNDNNEDELEIQFQSNSCSYVGCNEFNSLISKTSSNFSAFHLNIASISKHFDELGDLLAQLNYNFSCIGISETRNLVDGDSVPVSLEQAHDYVIPGYEKFCAPTESSAGGVSLYISNSFSYKPRDDLIQSGITAN